MRFVFKFILLFSVFVGVFLPRLPTIYAQNAVLGECWPAIDNEVQSWPVGAIYLHGLRTLNSAAPVMNKANLQAILNWARAHRIRVAMPLAQHLVQNGNGVILPAWNYTTLTEIEEWARMSCGASTPFAPKVLIGFSNGAYWLNFNAQETCARYTYAVAIGSPRSPVPQTACGNLVEFPPHDLAAGIAQFETYLPKVR